MEEDWHAYKTSFIYDSVPNWEVAEEGIAEIVERCKKRDSQIQITRVSNCSPSDKISP